LQLVRRAVEGPAGAADRIGVQDRHRTGDGHPGPLLHQRNARQHRRERRRLGRPHARRRRRARRPRPPRQPRLSEPAKQRVRPPHRPGAEGIHGVLLATVREPWHRMACKIHAAMRNRALSVSTRRSLRLSAVAFAAVAALVAAPAVHAEKADRFKPLNVEADLPGKIDLLRQFVVFNGNVVVTKGTMTIRADRIEVRELPDGYHTAVAFGSPGKHATFRQKRDVPDEYIAGDAERLEYD